MLEGRRRIGRPGICAIVGVCAQSPRRDHRDATTGEGSGPNRAVAARDGGAMRHGCRGASGETLSRRAQPDGRRRSSSLARKMLVTAAMPVMREVLFASTMATALAISACGSSVSSADGAAPGGANGGSAGRGGAHAGVGGTPGGSGGGGGGSGGGGGAAGSADAGPVDAGPPPREIHCFYPTLTRGLTRDKTLEPCAADGSCPDGQVCFRLSAELAVCDIAQQTAAIDGGCTPACEAEKICLAAGGGGCGSNSNYCWDMR